MLLLDERNKITGVEESHHYECRLYGSRGEEPSLCECHLIIKCACGKYVRMKQVSSFVGAIHI